MNIIEKTPAEETLFDFDFSKHREFTSGVTVADAVLAYIVVTGGGTITLGLPALSGSLVQYQITGGTLNADYEISCLATLSNGKKIQGYALLQVRKGR